MFRQMLYVCVLCASCGSSQCCVLHDLQFVNAGRGCNSRPYRRGILQSRSHNCFIGSHECLLLFTPPCCSECFSMRIVRAGVPQGSKLSPSLFNYYIADMPRPTPQVKRFFCYVDDITVWATGPKIFRSWSP